MRTFKAGSGAYKVFHVGPMTYVVEHDGVEAALRKFDNLSEAFAYARRLNEQTNGGAIKPGTEVYDIADPRHVGVVKLMTAYGRLKWATVQWTESGHYSAIACSKLRVVTD